MIALHPDIRTARLQQLLDALDADAAAGAISLYTGPQPSAGDAITTEVLLAQFDLGQPAGVITSQTLTLAVAAASVQAQANGFVAWGRLSDGAGLWVADGDAGLAGSGALFILDDLELFSGGLVTLLTAQLSEP